MIDPAQSPGELTVKTLKALLFIIVVLAFTGLIYLFAGAYNVGTDVPFGAPMRWLLSTLQSRSIATHANGLTVPALNDPSMIRRGARSYEALCSGCHLAPGQTDTAIRQGLLPPARDLSRGTPPPPARAFWAIQHGIKFTAMPAWGQSQRPSALWSLVAFVEQTPRISPAQYAAMTAPAATSSAPAAASSSAPPAAAGSVSAPAAAASTPASNTTPSPAESAAQDAG